MWTATPSTTRRVCHLGDTCPVSSYRPASPVPIPRAAVRQQAYHMTVTTYWESIKAEGDVLRERVKP